MVKGICSQCIFRRKAKFSFFHFRPLKKVWIDSPTAVSDSDSESDSDSDSESILFHSFILHRFLHSSPNTDHSFLNSKVFLFSYTFSISKYLFCKDVSHIIFIILSHSVFNSIYVIHSVRLTFFQTVFLKSCSLWFIPTYFPQSFIDSLSSDYSP